MGESGAGSGGENIVKDDYLGTNTGCGCGGGSKPSS